MTTLLNRATPTLSTPSDPTSVPLVSPEWTHDLDMADPTISFFSDSLSDAKETSSGAGRLYNSIPSGMMLSHLPIHLQTGPTGALGYFSQPQDHSNSTLMTPLAAYGEGLGGGNASLPVFAPAWLDQASALHRSQSESRSQGFGQ